MASSDTEIANMALGHLSVSSEISTLTTDSSAEAIACRRFFDTARQAVLRDFPWPFATQIEPLVLAQQNSTSDPSTEFGYTYVYPAKCLALRRILSGRRNDTQASRAKYRITRGSASRLILADQASAIIEYTYNETDENRFDADFVMALSYRLAVYIAPKLTGGDPFKLGERAMAMYVQELSRAGANAANEEVRDREPESEFVRARGGQDGDDFLRSRGF